MFGQARCFPVHFSVSSRMRSVVVLATRAIRAGGKGRVLVLHVN